MIDKNNIDDLFRESFKSFEREAPIGSWDAISKKVEFKKDRKKPFAWWPYAAAVVFLISITTFYLSQNHNDIQSRKELIGKKSATDSTSNQNSERITHSGSSDEKNTIQNSKIDQISKSNNTIVGVTSEEFVKKNDKNKTVIHSNNVTASTSNIKANQKANTDNSKRFKNNNNTFKENTIVNNATTVNDKTHTQNTQGNNKATVSDTKKDALKNTGIASSQKDNLNSDINNSALKLQDGSTSNTNVEKTNEVMETAVAVTNPVIQENLENLEQVTQVTDSSGIAKIEMAKPKWSAGTLVGPVFSGIQSGSSINAEGIENEDQAYNNSFGLVVNYQISERISIRSGVLRSTNSYNSGPVKYSNFIQSISSVSENSFNINGVSNANVPVNTAFLADLGSSFSQEFTARDLFAGFKGELTQELVYTEIPLEMRYAIIDKRFSLNLIAGGSLRYLTDNKVLLNTDSQKLDLGKDERFNDFSQSANFGFGVGYNVSQKIGLSIEPLVKYQFNIQKGNDNFKPYQLGLFTGLTYKF